MNELMWVHCAYCKHEWPIHGELPLLMDRFIELIEDAVSKGCEKCGARGVNIKCGALVHLDKALSS